MENEDLKPIFADEDLPTNAKIIVIGVEYVLQCQK